MILFIYFGTGVLFFFDGTSIGCLEAVLFKNHRSSITFY